MVARFDFDEVVAAGFFTALAVVLEVFVAIFFEGAGLTLDLEAAVGFSTGFVEPADTRRARLTARGAASSAARLREERVAEALLASVVAVARLGGMMSGWLGVGRGRVALVNNTHK